MGAAARTVRGRWHAAPPHTRQTWQLTAGSAVLGLVVALTSVAVAGPWDSGQRTAERARAAGLSGDSGAHHTDDAPGGTLGTGPDGVPEPAPSARAVLRALGSGTPPTREALDEALRPLLKDPALGSLVAASVTDAATGKELFASKAGTPATPASTVKLATGAAALAALGPDHRIRTRAVWDDANERVVLVGGGDPTVTGKQLAALAKRTASALAKRELVPEDIAYDTSRYPGTDRHPIGVNDNIAPVSPLMLNAARLDDSTRGPARRAADPAGDAGKRFAELLAKKGVRAEGAVLRATAPKKATELAVHRSAPLSTLVERMLTHSDNDIAEALARQTALKAGTRADFAGSEKAVRDHLKALDLPVDGARFADGSGLSRSNQVSARFLTALLALSADPDHAELRPLLTGLPVAGFNGTLGRRYAAAESAAGAGLVRAKTGTLTGVNSLAGTVVDADGRLLAFAFLTTGTTDAYGAQAALDKLAATVAACGCR
ncbi:D-alanyl-D-alanine carboxypeptidase/D-alanyl-D-alanine-endopeptidase [Streptomyces sp. 549]|uniref:D-alanyl-D-alanine carboxypeptidase/D-alanyl-D-alanine endopeptidase n=1 Tax=Streptomyces sp. 549 TaxID=3049076 RepID=UPI0024C2E7E2|nr:D-alanyl-D-alanine carboxypeptidase/D-alanyl-D-alanine-endopeptidase [Streptomyces sp. 549]MDK1472303.1 D-alanyl-D-alanine carboxypeptidase/D-alanyl-D-alanine-endopeptidase [Streptomyces sp. 549]